MEPKKEILKYLQDDARYTAKKIAVLLGIEEQTVAKAIAELEADGVIVKYTAVINSEKNGEEMVDALVEVKVNPQARRGFENIAAELCALEEVKSVYLMSGTYDFAITLEGSTMRSVAFFISERLSTIEGVTGVATHFILKKYKDGGVNLCGGDKRERIPIHE